MVARCRGGLEALAHSPNDPYAVTRGFLTLRIDEIQDHEGVQSPLHQRFREHRCFAAHASLRACSEGRWQAGTWYRERGLNQSQRYAQLLP